MSEMMKAVVYTGLAKVEWLDVPVPECGEDDIILEVKAAAICGADLHWYRGVFDDSAKAPFVLGHEFSGVIHEKGKNVSDYWQVGDRVVSENTGGACGHCGPCMEGNYVHCVERKMIGGGVDGGFAKYVKIPGSILKMYPNCLFKIPEEISFEEAAVIEPAAGAYMATIQEAKVMPGETVVVYGVGALGLFPIQMAKVAGASKIIAVGMKSDKETRFPLAKQYGATDVFASDEEENLPEKIKELTKDAPVSLVIDAVGVPSIMNDALKYITNEGRIVRIGNVEAKYNYSLVPIHSKMITVIGHMGYNSISWRNSIRLAKNRQIDLKSMVTKTIKLEEYEKGFQMMFNQEVARVVMIP